jgi:hypothetical protein
MSLLTEVVTFDQAKALVESIDLPSVTGEKKKHYYLQGIFVQGDIRNFNERIYPTHELQQAVKTVQSRIERGDSILGEADHPDGYTINIDRISHVIERMWMDGNNGMGRLKILSEQPHGKIVEGLLKEGIKLGVSSRGMGNIDDNKIVSDYELVTVDIVVQPSAPQAYPNLIYESTLNTKQGKTLLDVTKASYTDKTAEKYFHKEVINFIKALKL